MRDRRALVFLVFAAACFVLAPVAEREHRWVPIALGVVYVVLALASALDARTRARR
jgi:hypothetical protein